MVSYLDWNGKDDFLDLSHYTRTKMYVKMRIPLVLPPSNLPRSWYDE